MGIILNDFVVWGEKAKRTLQPLARRIMNLGADEEALVSVLWDGKRPGDLAGPAVRWQKGHLIVETAWLPAKAIQNQLTRVLSKAQPSVVISNSFYEEDLEYSGTLFTTMKKRVSRFESWRPGKLLSEEESKELEEPDEADEDAYDAWFERAAEHEFVVADQMMLSATETFYEGLQKLKRKFPGRARKIPGDFSRWPLKGNPPRFSYRAHPCYWFLLPDK